MQDLKDVTQEVHYENYRAERLSTKGQGPPSPRKTIEAMYVNNAPPAPHPPPPLPFPKPRVFDKEKFQ